MALLPLIAAVLVAVIVYLAGLALIWAVVIGVVVLLLTAGATNYRGTP